MQQRWLNGTAAGHSLATIALALAPGNRSFSVEELRGRRRSEDEP